MIGHTLLPSFCPQAPSLSLSFSPTLSFPLVKIPTQK